MSERRADDRGLISVTVNDGKYTIQQTAPGTWEALRFSEEWPAFRDSGPDNLHVALAYEIAALREQVADLSRKVNGCQWYWPEDDTSSDACVENPFQVLEWDKDGTVAAVSRGGIIETRYYAILPAAEDADSDDDFEVDEATHEAAQNKVNAELARRIPPQVAA